MATTRKKPTARKPANASRNGQRPSTLRALRESGYEVTSVRDELRRNLMSRLRNGEPVFPGIVGYEDTVIPQVENAILAGQDIILLGERGQAKSRMIRAMVELLDEEIPIVKGSEVNDDPLAPISRYAIELIEEEGDDTPIEWVGRDRRYGEKLATPDISIADLVGDVDPIRIAEGRYLSDELAIHYGLIPRTNRDLCINDCRPRGAQTRWGCSTYGGGARPDQGYLVRLPGRARWSRAEPGGLHEPGAHHHAAEGTLRRADTHALPSGDRAGSLHHGRGAERVPGRKSPRVPEYIKELIAEFTGARAQASEITSVPRRVRVSSATTRRSRERAAAALAGAGQAVPRITDFARIHNASTLAGGAGDDGEGRERRSSTNSIQALPAQRVRPPLRAHELDELVVAFEAGRRSTRASTPSSVYLEEMGRGGARSAEQARRGNSGPERRAQFVLEGLHLNRRLNRDQLEGRFRYRV